MDVDTTNSGNGRASLDPGRREGRRPVGAGATAKSKNHNVSGPVPTADAAESSTGNGTPALLPEHLEDLRRSGLSGATIDAMGVKSITNPADLRCLLSRQDLPDAVTGLAFPYLHTAEKDQCVRVKLFPPLIGTDGHSIRYLQARGTAPHLYRPPGVEATLQNPLSRLLLTEGEKKAAKAVQDGLPCLGLGGLWNWIRKGTTTAISELTSIAWMRRPVTLVPDSDVWSRPDLLHAVYALGRELARHGAVVDVAMLPPAADGGKVGLDDYLTANSLEDFETLTRVPLKDQAWQAQKDWYDNWRRDRSTEDDGKGQVLDLKDPEPWPHAVDGAALLDDLKAMFETYIILPNGAADALALWVLHAHAIEVTFVSPILALTSPEKRCAKTLTLELVSKVVPRPLLASSISPSAVFRVVEAMQPTLLIDEADTFLPRSEELRGVLNAGHTKGAHVVRCCGDDLEPRVFRTFGAKAVAAIKSLPGTVEDRAINIRMKRKAPGEKVYRLRRDRIHADCEPLQRKAARWVQDHLAELKDADPIVPPELHDRAADNWRPLLAIAELAGGDWPVQARKAALLLSGAVATEDENASIHLLADLKALFENQDTDRLASESIIEQLTREKDSRWFEWSHGKPLTVRELARLLRPFGIAPRTIRVGDKTPRGYVLEDLEDAFARYLPDPPCSDRNTATSVAAQRDKPLFHLQQEGGCCGSKNATLPYSDNGCGAVADEGSPLGDEGVLYDDARDFDDAEAPSDPDLGVFVAKDGSRWREEVLDDGTVVFTRKGLA